MPTRPFIATREVMVCCPNAVYWNAMAPAQKDRFFIPRWSPDRLRRHLAMLHAFGFNAIQTSAAGQLPLNAGVEDAAWEAKMVLLMQTAREMGMSVTFFKWGSFLYDNAKRAYLGDLDWHAPADRALLEAEYRHQARYAPYVDRVITHWVDPGGPKTDCPECSIDTAVEMHNRIVSLFAEANPRVSSYFSTWAMNWIDWPHWRGYEGVQTVAGHPALDQSVGIALECSNFSSDGLTVDPQARLDAAAFAAITRAGRKVGIWCWYTGDIEIQPSLHVHTALLERYFRHLGAAAPDGMDWHTIDDCSSGLNMHNLFIAGRLMRDPSLDAGDLLDEYVAGLVGDRAAPAVRAGLDAIELARGRSLRYGIDVSRAELAPPGAERRPTLDTRWLADAAQQVAAAAALVEPLTLAPTRDAAWPVTMPPAEFVEELKAHLHAVGRMLEVLQAVWDVRERAAGGASPAELEAAITAVPIIPFDPNSSTGLEAVVSRKKRDALLWQYGCWVTDAVVSPLQPAVADIRAVAPPDAALAFTPATIVPDKQFINIYAIHGGAGDGVLYIRGTVDLPRGGAGRLLYGADGPVKVWVNGDEAGCEPNATTPCTADAYAAPATWLPGRNEVLFALATDGGKAWGVMARVAWE